MRILSIKKAKLTNRGTVETTYIDGEGNEITFKGEQTAPPQLKDAFKGLVTYVADYTEQKEAAHIDSWDLLDSIELESLHHKLEVTGIIIGSGSNGMTVEVIGQRNLTRNGVMTIRTPKIEFDPINNDWELLVPFEKAVKRVTEEVADYIRSSQLRAKLNEADINIDSVEVRYDTPDEAPLFADD